HGHPVPAIQPSLRARTMSWAARRFGPGFLLPMLLEEEGREVKNYLTLSQQSAEADARNAALLLARESAEHAGSLAGLSGAGGEPWHKTGAGGLLRNIGYGVYNRLQATSG